MKENKRKILSVLAVSAALLGGVCICKYNEQPEATVVPDAKAVAAEILGQRADRVSDGEFSASSVNAKCNKLCEELGNLQAASSAVKNGFYDVTVQTDGNGCDKGADGKIVTLTAAYGNKPRVWTSNLTYDSETRKCTCTLKNVIGKYTISWKNANDETVSRVESSNSDSQGVYAGDHSYTSSITTQPTCTAEGKKTFTCRHCDETYTEDVDALGHNWNSGVVTTQPTCTAPGEKTFTCSRCGETQTEIVKATGHDWNSWEVTTQPTCTADGVKTRACSRCGVTQTEIVAAKGHNYVNHKCTRCSAWEEGHPTASEVQQIARDRKAAEVFPVGTLLQWDGKYYLVIGINQDTPCNSSGTEVSDHGDVLTLLFLGTRNGSFWTGYGTAPMNGFDMSAGGWKDSRMRNATMQYFIDSLHDVKDSIGWVQKANTVSLLGSGGGEIIPDNPTADKAFLLSYDEVFENGLMYKYFQLTGNRNLNNGRWWLRSPDDSGHFCYVHHGSNGYNYASDSHGVFPAICIY